MPIQQSMWKIDSELKELSTISLPSEDELEEILQNRIEILNPNWLVIGRQVPTAFNHYIDLLAINRDGSLIIIELKKARTPRDVVAQALDYASWVTDLDPEDIAGIYRRFSQSSYTTEIGDSFDDAFRDKFDMSPDEDELNSSHRIVIVASAFDSSTERIVSYLADSGVAINLISLKIFSDEGNQYLSRAWFMDPDTTEDTVRNKEPWNGEFYVSFGEATDERNWEDARKYGFISAGGGLWYTRTMNLLSAGDRLWVNIPQTGYVGVGRVLEPARKADEVTFEVDGTEKTIYELSDRATYLEQDLDDDDMAEYMVRVSWCTTVDRNQAVKETGFFGNQNTVCKPTSPKWNHTIDTLKRRWRIDD